MISEDKKALFESMGLREINRVEFRKLILKNDLSFLEYYDKESREWHFFIKDEAK